MTDLNGSMDILDIIDINVKWKNFNDNVNNRINGMWNYMIYNQFCEKEIVTLKNENSIEDL